MSPGRNVPPQIMLFISLGGSAARQHQAPGGRCARSPALPSSPRAAAAAAPGPGPAAATAPSQVSPGRARRPEAAGAGAGAGARGSGARRERGAAAGPRGRLTPELGGPGGGADPGAERGAERGPRARGGCGSGHPGARESARALGGARELDARVGEADPGASPGALGGGRGRSGPGLPPPGLWLGGKGASASSPPGLRAARPRPPAGACLGPGAARILFWELGGALPGQPSAGQAGRAGQGRAAGAPAPGRRERRGESGPVQPQGGEIGAPQTVPQGPPPFPLQRVWLLQAAVAQSTLTPHQSLFLQQLGPEKQQKVGEIAGALKQPPTPTNPPRLPSSCGLEYCFRDNEHQVGL